MTRRLPAVGFALVGAFMVACNALTGASDLVEGPPLDGDAGLVDAPVAVDAPVVIVDATPDAPKPPPDTGPAPPCPSAGRSCVPEVPAGWVGPVLAYEGERGKVPECPPEVPELADLNVGAPLGTIACSQCSCSGARSQTCSATMTQFSDAACVTPLRTETLNSTCKIPSTGGYASVRAQASVTSAGLCDPFVPLTGKAKSPVTWPNVLRLCGKATPFSADGCSTGELCVPNGATPFKTRTCIASADGSAVCPAPWTARIATFDGATDTRDCSTAGCSCATPSGVACAALIRSYSASDTCGIGASATTGLEKCLATPAGTSQRLQGGSLEATGGSCVPSGTPTATGAVVAGGTQGAVCCIP